MIIVSQDKDSLYNFDNVKSIDVLNNEIFITDDILADKGTRIAIYKTEERAKEVLQEIVKVYANGKTADEGNTFFGGFSWIPADTLYEMPKE